MERRRNDALAAICVLVSLSWVGATSEVRAQAAAAGPAEAEEAHYRNLVREALQEYQLGHWTEARTLLMAAHDLNPNARTLRGLGMVAFELRDYRDAAQLLDQSLKDERKPLNDAQRQEVQALLDRTERFLGRYRVNVPPPWESVRITIDGQAARLDETGHVALEVGKHELVVNAAGAQPRSFALDVRGGEREVLQADLQPVASVAAPEASAAAAATSAATSTQTVRPLRTWGIVLGATGVAALLTSGVLGPLALSASGDRHRDEDRAKSLGLATDILMGVGVVTATAGLSLWLVREDPKEKRSASARLSPHASAHAAGLVLRGDF